MSANLNDDNANGKNPVGARPPNRRHSLGVIRNDVQPQQVVPLGRDSERGTESTLESSYKQPSDVWPGSNFVSFFQSRDPIDLSGLSIEAGPYSVAKDAASALIESVMIRAGSCYRRVSSILPQSEEQSSARL